jgi:hypothetical protein
VEHSFCIECVVFFGWQIQYQPTIGSKK